MLEKHSFWFHKPPSIPKRWQAFSWSKIRMGLMVMTVCLLGLNLVHMAWYATTDHQDFFSGGDFKDIAAQIRWFDPELSRGLVALDRIIHSQHNKTISKYSKQDRESLRVLLSSRASALQMIVWDEAQIFLDTLSKFASYSHDRESLLWFTAPQTYLIILQNTAEKRPNGGFFWSFVKVIVDRGVIASFDIIDSYVPQILQPDTFILWPQRITTFLPEREIYFVGANKMGFTYQDGGNIKKLYERAYMGEMVRGVFFIRTDLLTKILPSLQEKLREWQFSNACVDLIRGEARSGKKELYMRDSLGFLKDYWSDLVKGFLAQADSLLADHYINLYLTDISGPLHTVIREGNLTTRFEEDTMYFRDSNISYNKIDQFVHKTIRFYNSQGDIVQQSNHDIVSIKHLPPGKYGVTIQYSLQVPPRYNVLIDALKQKYLIELTDREQHILGLSYERATRGVVYAPKHMLLSGLSGTLYHHEAFETPFSTNLYYKTKIRGNGISNVIEFQVEIRK